MSENQIEKISKFFEILGLNNIYGKKLLENINKMSQKQLEKKEELLNKLKKECLNCTKCELHRLRTNVVFGEGNVNSPLLFVGEAPGEQEDLEGRPFVGRAGKLLTTILNQFGIDRNKIYITNVLKCRPPNNRDPKPEEIKACFPYLKKQIEIIQPKVILCLGAFAARTLLNLPEKTPISKIRGKEFYSEEFKAYIIPTYHPAFLLRQRKGQEAFREDLKKALKLASLI